MRRKDREITDRAALAAIMESCDVCRLALNDAGYPYLLPLNFGFEDTPAGFVLYFHGALEGTKHELIARDNRASFEMDCAHTLHSDKTRGYCTMYYNSIIGRGTIDYITDSDEKLHALTVMTDHYHTAHFSFNPAAMPRTAVFRLRVTQLTGKRKQG